MRRRTLLINSSGPVDPSQAAPLEVAFYDGSDIVIRKQEEWLDEETPIGIVVVPGYHDRYGDGTCGIMSLVGMDYNHPENGEPITNSTQIDNVDICWGHYGSLVGNDMFVGTGALTSSNDYIPFQSNNASTACSANSRALVWPYAGTTTVPTSEASIEYSNTGGYVTATSGMVGCDFNGIRNTAACYVKTRTAAQWTASIVENAYETANTPAAACAGRFKTVGTKSFLDVFSGITSNGLNYGTSASTKDNTGFWYLPAQGEMCYLPRYKFEISKTILALNQKYGNVGIQLRINGADSSKLYWSSTESGSFGSRDAWVLTLNGQIITDSKYARRYVRAFMRL